MSVNFSETARAMAYRHSGNQDSLLRALESAGALVLRAYPAPAYGLASDSRRDLLQIHVRFQDGTMGFFSPGGPRTWAYRWVEGTRPGDDALPGVSPLDIGKVTTAER